MWSLALVFWRHNIAVSVSPGVTAALTASTACLPTPIRISCSAHAMDPAAGAVADALMPTEVGLPPRGVVRVGLFESSLHSLVTFRSYSAASRSTCVQITHVFAVSSWSAVRSHSAFETAARCPFYVLRCSLARCLRRSCRVPVPQIPPLPLHLLSAPNVFGYLHIHSQTMRHRRHVSTRRGALRLGCS
jgi:hypothetical protein